MAKKKFKILSYLDIIFSSLLILFILILASIRFFNINYYNSLFNFIATDIIGVIILFVSLISLIWLIIRTSKTKENRNIRIIAIIIIILVYAFWMSQGYNHFVLG